MSRTSLSTLLLGVAFSAIAVPAIAQDTAAPVVAADEATDEIVVTARRRAENLQDVPIAVTAYSGEALENQGALDITDVGDTTPNVTLEVSRGTNSTLSAFIRGVGQQDPVAGFEQGVGIYLDDVYLNRPQAAVLDIYDVERIEVLRGPQGTLYGRNTIGGAVKYVTKRLSDSPELRLRGNAGTYKQLDGIVSGSVPVGDGLLRVGGSLARLTRDGFGDNLTTGEENYNRDVWAARLSAEINNDDDVFVRIAADYTHDQSNARGGHRLIPSLFTNAPVLGDVFDTRGGLTVPPQDVEGYGFSANGEFEMTEALTFRTITAAFLLLNSSTVSASSTGLPRTWSATSRAFCAEMRAARNLAATSISLSSQPYRLAFLSTMWPRNVRVTANSPNLWPTMSSLIRMGTCWRPL